MKTTSAAAPTKGSSSAANANQVSQKATGKAIIQKAPHQGADSAKAQPFKANAGLPTGLQRNMETALGQDFSGVRIQRDSAEAANMGALAFTKGDNVHFAPGQFNPGTTSGQNLIGHEFTHVAQQRNGVVQPTRMLGKGLAANVDKGLEAEADAFGKMAARGEHIAKYRAPQNSNTGGVATVQAKSQVMQFATANTHYGQFNDDGSHALISGGAASFRRGCRISLRFTPNNEVDATSIAMVQTVQTVHNNANFFPNNDAAYGARAITNAGAINNPHTGRSDEGTRIDHSKSSRSPLYAVEGAGAGDTSLTDTGADARFGQHGYHYYTNPNDATTLQERDASLSDGPAIGSVDVRRNSGQYFETTALAIAGNQEGTYYGSVQWGWETDAAGNHTLVALNAISQGSPSSTFNAAAERWNASTTLDAAARSTLDLPTQDVHVVRNAAITLEQPGILPNIQLPVGTRVVITQPWHAPLLRGGIRVVDGPHVTKTGEVVAAEWGNIQDER